MRVLVCVIGETLRLQMHVSLCWAGKLAPSNTVTRVGEDVSVRDPKTCLLRGTDKIWLPPFNQWEVYHRQQTSTSAAVMIAIIFMKQLRGEEKGTETGGLMPRHCDMSLI